MAAKVSGPLAGITVLDLTANVAGPFCTMTLGDLGAEVIKIERPGRGDDAREWKPPEWDGYSTTFLALNRNKRSLAVNLDTPEGQEVVRRLAEHADVLVESFKPGSLAKRGLAYEQLRDVNPRLVYCSISGFGSRGPESHRPGYDAIIQARSGIMSITGEAGRPPVRVGASIIDISTGMWATIGILAALLRRSVTGRGERVAGSLLESGFAWMGIHLTGYWGSGKVPGKFGSGAAMMAPYEAFATADDYLLLGAPNDGLFVRLCQAIGLPELPDDPRFRTNPDRVANRYELHDIIEAHLRTRPARHWEQILVEAGIPCSRVQTVDQVAVDPQAEALQAFLTIPHRVLGELRLADLPITLNGQRSARHDSPPELGEHTDELLRRYGYDDATIAALKERGVIA